MNELKLKTGVLRALLHSAFIDGTIANEDLEDREKLFQKLKEIADGEIRIVVDHRETILRTANEFFLKESLNYAIIFYAMYFEHSINSIINKVLIRKKISSKTKNELIRTINIHGKFTWLLELLGLPKFNEKHKKIIIKSADERNAFIHYKFNPEPDQIPREEEKETLEFIKEIKRTVTYIKKYESRVFYRKNKSRVKRKINNHL